MVTKRNPSIEPAPIRDVEGSHEATAMAAMPIVKSKLPQKCEDCRADNAFHSWRSQHLTASFNWHIDFTEVVNIPAGKRAVVELVTATIHVPVGESARLRMYTSLGSAPSNLDFVLSTQGQVGGREILVGTHSVRVYSDHNISFNVNRDNAETEGDAIICISGYFVDV